MRVLKIQIGMLKERSILLFGFFMLTAIFVWFNFFGLYEKIALSGFTPIHYTHLKLFPENFVFNFRSGIEQYDKSIIMAIYPILGKYFEIPPELTLKFMIIFEYFVLFFTSLLLLKELRPQSGILEVFVLWLVFCSSYGMNADVANFGVPFFQGQFYNFAYFFGIVGILLCLKERFFLAAFCLMVTMLIHSTLGAMATFLAIFTFLHSSRLILQRRALIPFFVLGIGAVSWITWVTLQSHSGSGEIPRELWVSMTQMGNCHWYPYHLGFFTENPERFFVPFLCFLLLLVHYFPLQKNMTETDKKVIYVISAALLLTFAGIFISVFFPYPFLVKLCLHRASIFILFFGWPYLLSGIFQDIRQESALQKSMAFAILLFPFLHSSSVFMIGPTLLLMRGTLKGSFNHIRFFCCRLWIILLILGIFLFLWGIKGYGNYPAFQGFLFTEVGKKWWLYFFVIYIVFQLLDFLYRKNFVISENVKRIFPVVVLLFAVISFQRGLLLKGHELAKGRDYLETQRWANTYTPKDTLFMVDPTILYGWRDFSQRSSFGNFREWVHNSWLYDSDERIFKEGMRRFAIFKLPIENYTQGFFPTIQGHHKLVGDIEKAFYNFDENTFKDVQRSYGIQYIVMQKEKIKKQYKFPTAFENKYFVVFKLTAPSHNNQKIQTLTVSHQKHNE